MSIKGSQFGTRKKRRGLVIGGLLAAAIIAAATLSSRGEAGESPRHTVSTLDDLPTAASLPRSVSQWAARFAARGLAEPGTVKQLRANLGSRHSDVYAFKNTRGGICFLYAGYGGNCSRAHHLRETGIQWVVGDGVLVALVADDVKEVTLTVDGAPSPVSLQNNIAFGEYGDGETAIISVSYGDGPKQISKVTLNGSFPMPPG